MAGADRQPLETVHWQISPSSDIGIYVNAFKVTDDDRFKGLTRVYTKNILEKIQIVHVEHINSQLINYDIYFFLSCYCVQNQIIHVISNAIRLSKTYS